MSVTPLSVFRKNKMIYLYYVVLPCLALGISGMLVFGWHNIMFTFVIPTIPLILFIGSPFRKAIFLTAKGLYFIRKVPLFNLRLKPAINDSEFVMTPLPDMNKFRTWFFVCCFAWLVSITLSNAVGLSVTDSSGNVQTEIGSALITSIFFMPLALILAIALSMIDSSNLLSTSGRKSLIPVGSQIMVIILAILAVKTVFGEIIFGILESADVYRLVALFVMYLTASIVYLTFFEECFVSKFRKYLIHKGVRVRDPYQELI